MPAGSRETISFLSDLHKLSPAWRSPRSRIGLAQVLKLFHDSDVDVESTPMRVDGYRPCAFCRSRWQLIGQYVSGGAVRSQLSDEDQVCVIGRADLLVQVAIVPTRLLQHDIHRAIILILLAAFVPFFAKFSPAEADFQTLAFFYCKAQVLQRVLHT